MPYRIVQNAVQVQRPTGWETLKVHPTHAMALKHLAALEINVEHVAPALGKIARGKKP